MVAMGRNDDLYYNQSRCPDPTAYKALKSIIQEEVEDAELNKKAHNLVNVLKVVADLAGFEVVGRIQIRHKETKKKFK